MSRYRKTMREALEEIRGKVKEQQNLKEDGHTDVVSAKRQCSTIMEDARDISNKLGSLSPEEGLPSWWMNKLAVSSNNMNKLRDFFIHSEARQLKDPKKEMMVVKDGKVKVIDKSDWDKYKAKGYDMAEELEEGKMKDIFSMQQDGASVKDIAKKMGLDVQTVKDILGEAFTKKDFERNEDDNEHTKNSYELAKKFGDSSEKSMMTKLYNKTRGVGSYLTKSENDYVTMIQTKYYHKLKEENLKEYNPDFGKDASASRTQTSGEKDKVIKDDKDKDKEIQSLKNDIAMLKTKLENEKNKAVKPEPNPQTGEVPLTVGVAYKHFKDKEEKVKTEEIELDEMTFNKAMVDKLKKAYEPLRGKRIAPEPLMKIFDKIDSNKDALITLYKADIPFVSTLAGSRLSQKHNLSPMDIKRIISKEEVQESVKFKYALVDTSKDNEVVAMSSDEKDLKMSVHHRNRGFLKIVKLKKPTTKDIMVGYPLKEETELAEMKYDVKFDNVDGALGFREADSVEKELKGRGISAKVDLSDGDKESLSFNTSVSKNKMMKTLENLGYDLAEEVELTEYFATVHSKRPEIAKFINANKKGIDYVDVDAGSNIEFEGKGAHELADKVKAKFGVKVTKEDYKPLSETLPSMTKPMTVQYTYTRNPDLFDKTLTGTKTGKKMKNVGPKLKGVYVLKAPGQDHINFLQTLNSKGIMPKNKILGEEQKFEGARNLVNKILGERK